MRSFLRWLNRHQLAALTVSLGLVVCGLRLMIVDRFGSDVPIWDQWDAEADGLYLRFFQGSLGFSGIFGAYNEHRIVFTRLLGLAELLLNGNWDARLQCVVNACGYAAFAAVAFRFGAGMLAAGQRIAWFALCVVVFGSPLAWNNMIAGFHSAQFFLVALSLTACALLPTAPVGSPRWFAGWLCAALAPFSLAGGMLASVAVVAAVICCYAKADLRQSGWKTVVSVMPIIAAAAWSWVAVPGHDVLRPAGIGEFALTFWRCLQWPVVFFPFFPLIGWLPWTVLAWRCLRRRTTAEPAEIVLVAVGAWVVLQAAATAWSRGAGAPFPTSRYLDSLAIGFAVNGIIALRWLAMTETERTRKILRWSAVSIAAALLIAGMGVRFTAVLGKTLPDERAQSLRWESTLRTYLASGDRTILDRGPLMYHTPDVLVWRLSFPEIRKILPASIAPENHGRFSRFAAQVAHAGGLVAFASLALAVLAVLAGDRRRLEAID